jgi:glycosyltransferase involved in cell wall biosynthesis
MTDTPLITCVIPTRERCDTLGAAIRTCLMQDYDNMEIIISDNSSQDETKKVVESFNDKRITYVNTGKRLSMSHNWEFALSHVKGDYVTYLGDDDGLLPGALKELVNIISETKCEAISWRWASYFWPNCKLDSLKNLLLTPLSGALHKRLTSKALREVLEFKMGYHELPFLYKGIVSTKLITRIKDQSGGIFFHSLTPDVYSAIVIASALDTYLYSTKPYSVNGTSVHSIGASGFSCHSDKDNKSAATIFLGEENIPFHKKLYIAPSIPIAVAEAFFQAMEHFPASHKYQIDLKSVISAALREIKHAPQARCKEVVNAVREIGRVNNISEYAELEIKKFKNIPYEKAVALVPGYNFIYRHLIVDCSRVGIQDIYQASLLCGLLINHKKIGLKISISGIVRTSVKIAINLLLRWQKLIFNK